MWTKTGRRTLHLSGLLLWFVLTANAFAFEPALSDRAFTLLLAGAITATAGGLLASFTAPAQEIFQIGVMCGRDDERKRQLRHGDRGVDAPG